MGKPRVCQNCGAEYELDDSGVILAGWLVCCPPCVEAGHPEEGVQVELKPIKSCDECEGRRVLEGPNGSVNCYVCNADGRFDPAEEVDP